MSALSEQFDSFENTVSSGANLATIRMQLSALREQAEAFEARAKELEAETQNQDFTAERERLQSELTAANRKIEELQNEIAGLRKPPAELEPKGFKVLEFFFLLGPHSIGEAAKSAKIAEGMAKHYRDILLEMGLLSEVGKDASETDLYDMTPKGRQFVADHYARQRDSD